MERSWPSIPGVATASIAALSDRTLPTRRVVMLDVAGPGTIREGCHRSRRHQSATNASSTATLQHRSQVLEAYQRCIRIALEPKDYVRRHWTFHVAGNACESSNTRRSVEVATNAFGCANVGGAVPCIVCPRHAGSSLPVVNQGVPNRKQCLR
jgi:predicted dinucleotide-binding enzyme